jgi:hypothetical protein
VLSEVQLSRPAGAIDRGANLSPDGVYRFNLYRRWAPGPAVQVWIMLNPSTADHAVDDPTIRLCMKRAQVNGFAAIQVVNLYAYRTPSPQKLWEAGRNGVDIVGPHNRDVLETSIWRSAELQHRAAKSQIICAWGAGGEKAQPIIDEVVEWANLFDVDLHALRLTTNGQPGHPLYIPLEQQPFVWRAPR